MIFRIVFPNRKKNKKSDEIVHKKYILATETFEFGPLSPGKSRAEWVSVSFHFELCEKQMNAMLRELFYVVQHEEWAFSRDDGEDHHL